MKISTYKAKCQTFITMTDKMMLRHYLKLGFIEEVGELAGKFAKVIRSKSVICLSTEERLAIVKELGDVLWFAVCSCDGRIDFELSVRIVERLRYSRENLDPYRVYSPDGIEQCINNLVQEYCSVSLVGMNAERCEHIFTNVVIIANTIGYTLDEVMQINIDKLTDRRERGVINGSGDNR